MTQICAHICVIHTVARLPARPAACDAPPFANRRVALLFCSHRSTAASPILMAVCPRLRPPPQAQAGQWHQWMLRQIMKDSKRVEIALFTSPGTGTSIWPARAPTATGRRALVSHLSLLVAPLFCPAPPLFPFQLLQLVSQSLLFVLPPPALSGLPWWCVGWASGRSKHGS